MEEENTAGRVSLAERRGATDRELKHSRRDVLFGVFFSNIAMYFIILGTASTLFRHGATNIDSAAQAARALAPFG